MKRIVIVSDAWLPQVNGVVTTLRTTREHLIKAGHEVKVVHPHSGPTIPCPTYPEIRLSLRPYKLVKNILDDFQPDHIHIATEGPLGFAARFYCKRHKLAFTTSYHTQFPEYIRKRAPIPLSVSYPFFRWFHSGATRTLVGTPHQRELIESRGFKNVVLWSRGVNHSLFKPGDKSLLSYPRPIWAYTGRVAVEKNIESFLNCDLPGTKLIIGDGPALQQLKEEYPQAKFVGYKFGEELAAHMAASDVFVFPSLTDTFGIVMLEAMACGLPVAAFPVTGPRDVVNHQVSGYLDTDLRTAALAALELNPEDCIREAKKFTWEAATNQFFNHLTTAAKTDAISAVA